MCPTAYQADDDDDDDDGGGGDEGGGDMRGIPWGGVCTEPKYLEALQVVESVARMCRNDKLLRTVLREQHKSKRKCAVVSTAATEVLRAAARKDRMEEETQRWHLSFAIPPSCSQWILLSR